MIWINLKFLRLYSLLLLAVYRYTSVFRIHFYRLFNASLFKMSMAIVGVWCFSLLMSFSLKYIFGTSYSKNFCYEGYSDYWLDSVLFFIFLIVLSYVIPSVIVIVLYKRIIDKLKELTKNLNKNNQTPVEKSLRYSKILAKLKNNKINNTFKLVMTPVVFVISNTNTSGQNPPPQNDELTMIENEPANQAKHTNHKRSNFLNIRENKNPKQKRFAQQMILINLITCIGSVFSTLTNIQVNLSEKII